MLWLTENLADQGTWTSLNGSDAYFPVANVQDDQVGRVWKSTGANATEALTIDLSGFSAQLTGQDVHVVIHGHNIPSGQVVAAAATNGLNTWGDTYDPDDFPGRTIHFVIPSTDPVNPPQQLDLLFAKGSAAFILQVGRIYVGTAYDSGSLGDPDFDGVAVEHVDPSLVSFSPGRQRFVERRAQFDTLKLDFSFLDESVIAEMRAFYQDLGKYKPFFLKVSTVSPLDRVYYVAFAGTFPEKVAAFGSGFLWNHNMTLEEQL